jgi:hypothetical protein
MKGTSTLAAVLMVASFVALPTLRAEQTQPQAKGAPKPKKIGSALSTVTSFAVINADGSFDHGSPQALSSTRMSTGLYNVVSNIQDRLQYAYTATSLGQNFNPVSMTISFDLASGPGELLVLAADNSKQPTDTAFSLIVVCPET